MFCPNCGENLKLEKNEQMSLLIKSKSYYYGECKKKHKWQIEIDYMDDGRTLLSELRDFDD